MCFLLQEDAEHPQPFGGPEISAIILRGPGRIHPDDIPSAARPQGTSVPVFAVSTHSCHISITIAC